MLAKRRIHEIDSDIGRRIRLRRLQMKISQSALGNALGVTFQQVQKYEKGTNRVSAGRLQRIAEVFEVPISFFYKSSERAAKDKPDVLGFLESAYAFRLLQAFSNIPDKKVQMSLLMLVEQIAAGKKR